MIDQKICGWLMESADAPVKYRVARELLRDEKTAKNLEGELFENKEVQKWLKLLKPEMPIQRSFGYMEHGSFDFCLENALPKLVQLGLHGGFGQIVEAVGYYTGEMQNVRDFVASKLLTMADVKDETALSRMLGSLDKIYSFAKQGNYDIYIGDEEKKKLTGIPKGWKDKNFINPELFENGYSYPLIYDIISMHRLYELNDPAIDEKIDCMISYISTDEFHEKIADGYGILISGRYRSGNPQYHGMGWDPKYPGWFDPAEYIEHGGGRAGTGVPKLLFFALHIGKYPAATKTKWFGSLLDHLEKYRTGDERYLFPADWLQETRGYAVQGHHISFGENRRKKNWLEIESTFYMQSLRQNIS